MNRHFQGSVIRKSPLRTKWECYTSLSAEALANT